MNIPLKNSDYFRVWFGIFILINFDSPPSNEDGWMDFNKITQQKDRRHLVALTSYLSSSEPMKSFVYVYTTSDWLRHWPIKLWVGLTFTSRRRMFYYLCSYDQALNTWNYRNNFFIFKDWRSEIPVYVYNENEYDNWNSILFTFGSEQNILKVVGLQSSH